MREMGRSPHESPAWTRLAMPGLAAMLAAMVPGITPGTVLPAQAEAGVHRQLRGIPPMAGDVTPVVESLREGLVVVHPDGTQVWMDAVRGKGIPDTPGGADTRSGPTSACSDSAYALYSNEWVDTLEWWFNSQSTPDGIDVESAKSALRDAATVVTHATNDCGLSDKISNTAAYQGTTSTSVNINSNSTCSNGDGKSVVGFGNLASSTLAMACWWTNSKGHTTEADIRFNKEEYNWTVSVPTGCTNKFVIKAVATHEFGHAYGLAHVSEPAHGSLTMSTLIMACQKSEATLGLGDLRGFEAKY